MASSGEGSGFQPHPGYSRFKTTNLSSSKKVSESLQRLKTTRSRNRRSFSDLHFSYDSCGRRITKTPSRPRRRRTATVTTQGEEQGWTVTNISYCYVWSTYIYLHRYMHTYP